MNKINISYIYIILFITLCVPLRAQVEVSGTGSNSSIVTLGKRSLLTGTNQLFINSNSIWSSSNGIFPSPNTLRLNTNGNGVSIGALQQQHFSDNPSALIIDSNYKEIDLHLGGRGQISTNGSFYLKGYGNEFNILNGEDQILFRYSENNSIINGDILIDGSLIKDPEVLHYAIDASNFEVIGGSGSAYVAWGRGAYNDEHAGVLGASINVPDGALITKVTAKFYDNSSSGDLRIYLIYSPYSMLENDEVLIREVIYETSLNFNGPDYHTIEKVFNGHRVNLMTGKYYIRVNGANSEEISIKSIIVEYTN